MKRFIFSLFVSFTCIAIGATTLFFELGSYDVVSFGEYAQTSTKEEFQIKEGNEWKIEVSNDRVHVKFSEEGAEENKISIAVPEDISYTKKDRLLQIDSVDDHDDWYDEYDFRDYIDEFMDGLKHDKIMVYDSYRYERTIVVTCLKKNRRYVDVVYH